MPSQEALLMTAARQVVDAQVAFARARDDLTFARAQWNALSDLAVRRGKALDELDLAPILATIARIDQELESLRDAYASIG